MGDETPATKREALGFELEQALEGVIFNLEHGVPRDTLKTLERLAEELSGHFGRDSDLFDDLRRFHAAVARLFREPDAVGDLLRHGRRLVDRLAPMRPPKP